MRSDLAVVKVVIRFNWAVMVGMVLAAAVLGGVATAGYIAKAHLPHHIAICQPDWRNGFHNP